MLKSGLDGLGPLLLGLKISGGMWSVQKLHPSKLVGLTSCWLWSLGWYVMSSPVPISPPYLA